jgi:pathogen-inducible salicylic acid glucosyltransferase
VDELLRSEQAQGRPVHVLVYDAFMPWAQRRARRHCTACAAFFTQSCAVDVAYAHTWTGRVKPPLLADDGPVEMPGLPAELRSRDLPTFLVEAGDCLDLVVNQFKDLDTADQVLVNSFYELEPQVYIIIISHILYRANKILELGITNISTID